MRNRPSNPTTFSDYRDPVRLLAAEAAPARLSGSGTGSEQEKKSVPTARRKPSVGQPLGAGVQDAPDVLSRLSSRGAGPRRESPPGSAHRFRIRDVRMSLTRD